MAWGNNYDTYDVRSRRVDFVRNGSTIKKEGQERHTRFVRVSSVFLVLLEWTLNINLRAKQSVAISLNIQRDRHLPFAHVVSHLDTERVKARPLFCRIKSCSEEFINTS